MKQFDTKYLEQNGYQIIDIENLDLFNQLRVSLIKKLNLSDKTNIEHARIEIAKMSKAEVNKSMISLLKKNNLSEMMVNAFPNLIKKVCSEELFLQRRADNSNEFAW